MNQQVAGNLEKIITALENDEEGTPEMAAAPDNTAPIIAAARHRHELTRARAIQAIRELDHAGSLVTFAGVAGEARDLPVLALSSARHPRRDRAPPGRHRQVRPTPSRPASAPPTPHCFAAWKPPTPNEPASWKNAHGSARRTPGSAGSSPSPSANSDRPGSAASSHRPDPSPSDNDQTPHAGPQDLAADASRSPSSTRPPRSARPQTARLKIIVFSVIQRKVLTPDDFADLDQLAAASPVRDPLQRHRPAVRLEVHPRRPQRPVRRIDAHDKNQPHALAA